MLDSLGLHTWEALTTTLNVGLVLHLALVVVAWALNRPSPVGAEIAYAGASAHGVSFLVWGNVVAYESARSNALICLAVAMFGALLSARGVWDPSSRFVRYAAVSIRIAVALCVVVAVATLGDWLISLINQMGPTPMALRDAMALGQRAQDEARLTLLLSIATVVAGNVVGAVHVWTAYRLSR